MENVSIEASKETLVTDLRAALDTYGVEIALPESFRPQPSRVFLRVPLFYIQDWTKLFGDQPVEALEGPPKFRTSPDVYEWLTVKLVQAPGSPFDIEAPPRPGEAPQPDYTRWPFFVDSEMVLTIKLDKHVWVATFHPFQNPKAKNPKRRSYEEFECLKISA